MINRLLPMLCCLLMLAGCGDDDAATPAGDPSPNKQVGQSGSPTNTPQADPGGQAPPEKAPDFPDVPEWDALIAAVKTDPGLEQEPTLVAIRAVMDWIDKQHYSQPAGQITWERYAEHIGMLYRAVDAALWFDFSIKDDADRLRLVEAHFHFRGGESFESYKTMDRSDPKFIKFLNTHPEALALKMQSWFEIIAHRNLSGYDQWSERVRSAAEPFGLPVATRADLLRAAVELAHRRELPRGI